MTIKIGSENVDKVYIGGSEVNKIYLGETQIYPDVLEINPKSNPIVIEYIDEAPQVTAAAGTYSSVVSWVVPEQDGQVVFNLAATYTLDFCYNCVKIQLLTI